MSFSKIKYFLFGILVSATLNVIITQANPDDGVFGVYFERMTGICPTNNVITSYSSGGVFGARECTPLTDLLGSVFGAATIPPDSSVIGINADGTLKYKNNIWKENGTDISYTGGKVGIGTDIPASKLDITGGSVNIVSGNIQIGGNTMAATVNISDTSSYFNGPYVGFGKNNASVPLDILGDMRISTNLDVQTIFLNTQSVLIPNNCSGNNVALQWTGNAWICIGI